jgi:hypothetical protein
MGPLPDNPSSPCAAAIAAEKLDRASNYHLAEFNLHLDGRPIGKLAATIFPPFIFWTRQLASKP